MLIVDCRLIVNFHNRSMTLDGQAMKTTVERGDMAVNAKILINVCAFPFNC